MLLSNTRRRRWVKFIGSAESTFSGRNNLREWTSRVVRSSRAEPEQGRLVNLQVTGRAHMQTVLAGDDRNNDVDYYCLRRVRSRKRGVRP